MSQRTSHSDLSLHEKVAAESFAAIYESRKISRYLLQPILFALLVTSLYGSILVLIENITHQDFWIPLSLIFLLASLESSYTTLWLKHPKRKNMNKLAYRTSELLLIILILLLFSWAITDSWPEVNDLRLLLRYPILLFQNYVFVIGAILTTAAWGQTIVMTNIFERLELDYAEVYYYHLPPSERLPENQPVGKNRLEITASFFRQWIGGGVILAICVALSSIDLYALRRSFLISNIQRLGLRPHMLGALIIFFLAGLTLVNQARFMSLNARWMYSNASVQQRIENNWLRNSLGLLLIIALIAAFLPLGQTFGIARILEAIIFGFMVLVSLFIALLSSLIPPAPESTNPPPTTAPVPTPSFPPPDQPPPAAPNELLALIITSLFWAVIVVMTITAISYFLRDRGIHLEWGPFKQAWANFIGWLRMVWQGTSEQVSEWQEAIRSQLRTLSRQKETKKKPPWRFIRLNSLSPREQIRYFYLSTVKRAGIRGVARQQNETPLEYAQDLKENWPEAETDVDELTEAFLQARYSSQPIDKEDVKPVKAHWKKVKSNLRKRVISDKTGGEN